MNESEFIELYTYILNQNEIPAVTIDTTYGEVFVPREYIDDDGVMQLCLSPIAVRDLKIVNDTVYCRATFNRKVFSISFPLANIIAMSIDKKS